MLRVDSSERSNRSAFLGGQVIRSHGFDYVFQLDDVIKWKHFPRYWPFVWGIHWLQVNSAKFHVFFDLRLNKRLSKHWRRWWCETLSCLLWCHCNDIKRSSYLSRKSHCVDKTVVRSSYLHNGISYTGKVWPLYWIGAQVLVFHGYGFQLTLPSLCREMKWKINSWLFYYLWG